MVLNYGKAWFGRLNWLHNCVQSREMSEMYVVTPRRRLKSLDSYYLVFWVSLLISKRYLVNWMSYSNEYLCSFWSLHQMLLLYLFISKLQLAKLYHLIHYLFLCFSQYGRRSILVFSSLGLCRQSRQFLKVHCILYASLLEQRMVEAAEWSLKRGMIFGKTN